MDPTIFVYLLLLLTLNHWFVNRLQVLIQHRSFRRKPSAKQRWSLLLIFYLIYPHHTRVVIFYWFRLILSLEFLQFSVSIHFLWQFVQNVCIVVLNLIRIIFQGRELLHIVIVLVSFLYQIVSIGSKQSVELLLNQQKLFSWK